MRWYEGPLAGVDLETTSANPMTARIVTASVLHRIPDAGQVFAGGTSWIVSVEEDISPEAAAIHGFTTERARAEGRPLLAVLPEMVDELRAGWARGPMIDFNASFDLTILLLELERAGLPTTHIGPVVDPLVIDRQVDRYRRGGRKLSDVAAHYGVQVEQAHDAGADALTAMRVAWQLGKRFPKVGLMSPLDLHAAQVGWAREQRESLEAHFTTIGKPQKVDRGWPVQDAYHAGR